jgi:hypothetical protein
MISAFIKMGNSKTMDQAQRLADKAASYMNPTLAA